MSSSSRTNVWIDQNSIEWSNEVAALVTVPVQL